MENIDSLLKQFTGGGGGGATTPAPKPLPNVGGGDQNQNGIPDAMETINLKIQRPANNAPTPRTLPNPVPAAATVPPLGGATGVTQGMRDMGRAAYEAYQQRIQQQTANTANQNLTNPQGENAFNIIRFARTPQGMEAIRAVIEKIRSGSSNGSPAVGNALERILAMTMGGQQQGGQ